MRSPDPAMAHRFWQALHCRSISMFKIFRARFIGRVSPHPCFWGGCDLAVTRYLGRARRPPPGGVTPHVTLMSYGERPIRMRSARVGCWPSNSGYGRTGFQYVYVSRACRFCQRAGTCGRSLLQQRPSGSSSLPLRCSEPGADIRMRCSRGPPGDL